MKQRRLDITTKHLGKRLRTNAIGYEDVIARIYYKK